MSFLKNCRRFSSFFSCFKIGYRNCTRQVCSQRPAAARPKGRELTSRAAAWLVGIRGVHWSLACRACWHRSIQGEKIRIFGQHSSIFNLLKYLSCDQNRCRSGRFGSEQWHPSSPAADRSHRQQLQRAGSLLALRLPNGGNRTLR